MGDCAEDTSASSTHMLTIYQDVIQNVNKEKDKDDVDALNRNGISEFEYYWNVTYSRKKGLNGQGNMETSKKNPHLLKWQHCCEQAHFKPCSNTYKIHTGAKHMYTARKLWANKPIHFHRSSSSCLHHNLEHTGVLILFQKILKKRHLDILQD